MKLSTNAGLCCRALQRDCAQPPPLALVLQCSALLAKAFWWGCVGPLYLS